MTSENFGLAEFFIGHLPSFTRLGYACRKTQWPVDSRRFDGQRWLVTGASAGIGREIAAQAAAAGGDVIAAARSVAKLAALADEGARGRGSIEPLAVDLALTASVAAVVDAVARTGPLDVLVNNVGVLLDTPQRTREDRDQAFATNLLVPYLLTRQLDASGLLEPDATIITMSSGGMYNVPLQISKLDSQANYDGVMAYARHNRAQVALNAHWRRHAAASRQYYVMHPGWVDTSGVQRALPMFHLLMRPMLRDLTAGADTALWLAQTRPAQAQDAGIWFDRALRPHHVLTGTRGGDSVAELVDRLDRAVQQ